MKASKGVAKKALMKLYKSSQDHLKALMQHSSEGQEILDQKMAQMKKYEEKFKKE